jgi:hypothetical protein
MYDVLIVAYTEKHNSTADMVLMIDRQFDDRFDLDVSITGKSLILELIWFYEEPVNPALERSAVCMYM